MRKIFIGLLSGCILLGFVSCKKSSSGNPSSSSGKGNGTITGTGGATFNVSGSSTFFQEELPNTTGNITADTLISLLGTISSTQSINIQLYDISTTGTYSLSGTTGPSSAAIVYNANDSGYTSVLAVNPGTVTVTAISATNITGTYSTTVSTANHTIVSFNGTFTGTY